MLEQMERLAEGLSVVANAGERNQDDEDAPEDGGPVGSKRKRAATKLTRQGVDTEEESKIIENIVEVSVTFAFTLTEL